MTKEKIIYIVAFSIIAGIVFGYFFEAHNPLYEFGLGNSQPRMIYNVQGAVLFALLVFSLLLIFFNYVSGRNKREKASVSQVATKSKLDVNWRRVIAREFLFVIGCVGVLLGTYGICLLINMNRIKTIENINKKIDGIEQNNTYEDNDGVEQIELYKLLKSYVETAKKYEYDYSKVDPEFPQLDKYDRQLLMDYIATAEYPEYKGDMDIVNSKFPEFNIKYSELRKQRSNINMVDFNDVLQLVAIVIISVFFGGRYLIYMLIWSVKQVRNKD